MLLAAASKNPHLITVCRSPGIDVNILDQKGLTALDTVKDMPSQKSREIAALILGEGQKKMQWEVLLIAHLPTVLQSPVCLLQVT